jgi:hopanoid biosynthesis associated protein HpnK
LPKYLIVNADDFGFTCDVNVGIVEAYQTGILRATTLMANGGAFEDAVALARANPGLDIGCHLTLVQGRSVARPDAMLPGTVAELIRALAVRRIDPYVEMRAQIQRILEVGLRLTHLDTHKHTHLLPPVLRAAARLSAEFGIPWVRLPFDIPLNGGAPPSWVVRATSRSLRPLRGRVRAVLARHGCRMTDHFAGFQITGRLRTQELVELIRQLPEGTTELMCHPGRCTDELRAAHTRLKESREAELEALKAPEVRAAIQEAGVRLVSFGAIF